MCVVSRVQIEMAAGRPARSSPYEIERLLLSSVVIRATELKYVAESRTGLDVPHCILLQYRRVGYRRSNTYSNEFPLAMQHRCETC